VSVLQVSEIEENYEKYNIENPSVYFELCTFLLYDVIMLRCQLCFDILSRITFVSISVIFI